jgi:hypothetical protein
MPPKTGGQARARRRPGAPTPGAGGAGLKWAGGKAGNS